MARLPITRTLDRGASGIVGPHVSTKAEAARVVDAARLGPIGLRGMFGGRFTVPVRAIRLHVSRARRIIVVPATDRQLADPPGCNQKSRTLGRGSPHPGPLPGGEGTRLPDHPEQLTGPNLPVVALCWHLPRSELVASLAVPRALP